MVLNSLSRLISINTLTGILGIIYSILLVQYFGASREIEIFFIAQTLLYVTFSLTQTGHLAEIFLPEFLKLENIAKNKGFNALNVILNRFLLFGCPFLIVFFVSAAYMSELIAPGFASEEKALVATIFRLLVPLLAFQIIVSFFRIVLNGKSIFGTPELIVAITVAVNIFFLVFFYETLGIWTLVYSMFVGRLFEFLFYIFIMYRIGYRYEFLLITKDFNHKKFFRAFKNTIMYVSSTSIFNFALTASASFLSEGVYAIFKYVQLLVNKVFSIVIMPFITIFFTEYSKNREDFRLVNNYFRALISVNVCMIMGSVVLGRALLQLLWGSQKFDELSVDLAYIFLLTNIIAIVIASFGNIYRKMAVSMGYGRMLYSYWSLSQIASACFAVYIISTFETYGLMSIISINFALLAFTSAFVFYQTGEKWRPFISRVDTLILSISLITSLYLTWFLGIDADFVFSIDNLLFILSFSIMFAIYPLVTIIKALK